MPPSWSCDGIEGSSGGGILGGAPEVTLEGTVLHGDQMGEADTGDVVEWSEGWRTDLSGILITPALGGVFFTGEAEGVDFIEGGGGLLGGEGRTCGTPFCCTSGIPKPLNKSN